MAQIATVATITGKGTVFAVNEQGVSRQLKAGDVLQKGETIRTVGDVQVELRMDDGRPLAVAPNQTLRLDDNVTQSDQRPTAQDSAVIAPAGTADTVIQALERGTDLSTQLEATAAGLGGGAGADGGNTFVQLLRIVEGVDPLAYAYEYKAPDLLPDLDPEPGLAPATIVASITIDPITGDNILNAEEAKQPFVTITGTVGGDVKLGDIVTLTINGKDYTGPVTVDANGKLVYSIPVETASLKADSTIDAKVSTTDAAGNTATATDNGAVQLEGVSIEISIASVDGASTTVNEAGLTSPADQGEINGGSFDIATNLGVAAVTIGGTSFTLAQLKALSDANPSAAIDTGEGWMRITGFVGSNGDKAGTISFTYELKAALDNVDDPATEKDEGASFLDSVAVSVTGIGGTVANASIGIDIVDDVPTVTVNAAAEGAITLTTQDAQTTGDASDTASASFAAALLSAAVPAYGADGAGSTVIGGYTLNVTNGTASGLLSHGESIVLNKNEAGEVVGSTTNGGAIFKISVDANGTVTLTQYSQIDHVGADNGAQIALAEGKVSLSATVTTTDHDGDAATATVSADLGGNIVFEDDVPTITASTAVADTLTLTTQDADTIGAATDTATPSANFATAFETAANTDRNYGADGAGTTVVSGYTLNVTGLGGLVTSVNSGLDSNGLDVMLTKALNGDVVGSTTAGEVFRISVSSTGTVTLTQSAELDHVGTGNGSQIALGSSLVTLSATATVTDGDTDTATATYSVDLGGGNIVFEDDVPTITASTAVADTLTLTTQDADTIGAATDTATPSANFATAFETAANTDRNYGADGAGTTVVSGYTLNVTGLGGLVTSVNSGLDSNGLDVMLTKALNGDVVGSTTAGEVFRISVSSTGTVTLTQSAELDHVGTGNGSQIALGSSLVTLSATATVTDGDTDTATATYSVDLGGGNIVFEDDVPTITASTAVADTLTLTTQDADTIGAATDTATPSANFATAFETAANTDRNYGADGAGTTVVSGYTLNVTGLGGLVTSVNSGLDSNGLDVMLTKALNGDVVGSTTAGEVFRISVSSTGTVTLTQSAELDHVGTGNGSQIALGSSLVTLSATATVTDGDTDTATATYSVDLGGGNIVFEDDVPTITASTAVADTLTLTTQDADTIGAATDTATPSANFATAFETAANTDRNYGADGAGTTVVSGYTLNVTGLGGLVTSVNSGLDSNGLDVMLTKALNGDVVGSTTAGEVFRISVSSTGTVTLTQSAELDHVGTGNGSQIALGSSLVTLSATATVTDGDTDTATATYSVDLGGGNIVFEDDVPTITASTAVADTLTLTTQDADTIGAATDTATPSANFATAFETAANTDRNYGADGAGTTVVSGYTLNVTGLGGLVTSVNSGLDSNGLDVMLTKALNGDVVGSTTAGEVFRISVSSTGTVTLTQSAELDHVGTGNGSQIALGSSLVTLSATATVTDGDTDTATATYSVDLGGGNIVFEDDVPTITASTAVADTLTLTTQDADTIGAATDTATPSANFATAFETAANTDRNYGADGAGTTVVSGYTLNVTGLGGLVTSVNSGLDSNGLDVMLTKALNGDVVGSTTAGEVFRISVSSTGTVTLTQSAELDHVGTGNGSQIALGSSLVTLSATATVTDGDTDTATATYSVDLGGGNIVFEDDVPTITASTAVADTLTLTTQDADTIGAATDTATPSANFATAFETAANTDRNYGADGAGTTVVSGYTLNVTGLGGLVTSVNSGLDSNGLDVMLTKALNGDVVGSTTAGEVFRISVSSTGTVTLTQSAELDHVGTGNGSQIALGSSLVTLSATATVTDGDTDTATATYSVDLGGGNIVFEDDVPTITASTAVADTLTLTTQDADTIGAATDTATPSANFATAFETAANTDRNYGADGAGTTVVSGYTLNVTGLGGLVTSVNSGLDSNGLDVMLTKALNGDVVGSTTAGEVFRISVSSTGTVTLTQSAELDHVGTGNGSQIALGSSLVTLSATATVTDGDTDTATATYSVDLGGGNIVFEDDVPTLSATNAGGYMVHSLYGDITLNQGADGAALNWASLEWTNIPVVADPTVAHNFTFTESGGVWSAKYIDDTNVERTWFTISQSTMGDGADPDLLGYQFVLVTPPVQTISSGNLLQVISAPQDTVIDVETKKADSAFVDNSFFGGNFGITVIAYSGSTAGVLSASSVGLGVGGNTVQSNGNSITLDADGLVTSATTGGDVVRFDITGNESTGADIKSMTIALDTTGSIAIGDTIVLRCHTSDGEFFVKYVYQNDQAVTLNTSSLTGTLDYIDLFTVSQTSGNITMKVVGVSFDYTTQSSPADAEFNFALTATDGDGDIAATTFAVSEYSGTSADDELFAGDGDDAIHAGVGNDIVGGGAGIDALFGEAGLDTLIGGAGNDTLDGGADSDVFVWSLADVFVANGTDVVKNFQVGSGGDVLDLKDLLVDINGTSGAGSKGAGWDATDLSVMATNLQLNLTVSQDANGNLNLTTIDTNGATGGGVQTIVLEGVTATSLQLSPLTAPGTFDQTSQVAILQKLLTDGNIKHD